MDIREARGHGAVPQVVDLGGVTLVLGGALSLAYGGDFALRNGHIAGEGGLPSGCKDAVRLQYKLGNS